MSAIITDVTFPLGALYTDPVNPLGIDPLYTWAPTQGFDSNPFAVLSTGVPAVSEVAAQAPEGSSLTDIIGAVMQGYLLTRQQKAFLDLNRELVSAGRPPISWEQFGTTANVGVTVDTEIKKMMWLFGAVGVGALLFMAARK